MWNHVHMSELPPLNWLITLHFFHVNGMTLPLHCLTRGSAMTFVSDPVPNKRKIMYSMCYIPVTTCNGKQLE